MRAVPTYEDRIPEEIKAKRDVWRKRVRTASKFWVEQLSAAVFDHPIALGTVHHIMTESVAPAREVSSREALSAIREGAHDELFQGCHPILVGCDVHSTYCYLLVQEDHRDGTT